MSRARRFAVRDRARQFRRMHPPRKSSLASALAIAALVASASVLEAQPPRPASAASSGTLAVVGLETDAAAEPLGIDDRAPRLSWRLESTRRAVAQSSYRLLVASRPELLRDGRGDVWDSGEIASAQPWAIYAGKPLVSRTRYYWTVRVRTSARLDAASRPAWFETALLDSADWKGRWIAGPERARTSTVAEGAADDASIRASGEFCRPTAWPTVPLMRLRPNDQGECRAPRPAPMLRKSFRVSKPVARARLYASGLGYGDLSVNGTAASDRVPARTWWAWSSAPGSSTTRRRRGTGGGTRPSGVPRHGCGSTSW
jgi:hypothetical protein